MKIHKFCRPPKTAVKVERLLKSGKWIPDDGKPGLAFSGEEFEFPCSWSVECDCGFDFDCPCYIALNHTGERFGCANGRTVAPIFRDNKK